MRTEVYKLPVKPSVKNVMTRLGIKHTTNDNKLTQWVEAAISQVEFAGVCGYARASVTQDAVMLDEKTFTSAKFAAYMDGCESALLLAATAGQGVADRIGQLMSDGKHRQAVVLDAAAAAGADNALGFMVQAWARDNSRRGLVPLKRRFSPGYGDLPLSCQQDLFHMLDAGRLGMGITEAYMLTPDKSVIAICGVKYVVKDNNGVEGCE